MIGIIFVIICAGLIEEEIAGESLRIALETCLLEFFLSTRHAAHSTRHFPLTCTQQNSSLAACTGEPVGRPSTVHYLLIPAQCCRLIFRHTVSLSEKIRARFSHTVAVAETPENPSFSA